MKWSCMLNALLDAALLHFAPSLCSLSGWGFVDILVVPCLVTSTYDQEESGCEPLTLESRGNCSANPTTAAFLLFYSK